MAGVAARPDNWAIRVEQECLHACDGINRVEIPGRRAGVEVTIRSEHDIRDNGFQRSDRRHHTGDWIIAASQKGSRTTVLDRFMVLLLLLCASVCGFAFTGTPNRSGRSALSTSGAILLRNFRETQAERPNFRRKM